MLKDLKNTLYMYMYMYMYMYFNNQALKKYIYIYNYTQVHVCTCILTHCTSVFNTISPILASRELPT